MSFEGKISGSLAPQGAKTGNISGSIGAVVPDIRDESVTTAKIADAAVTIAKLAQDVTALINSKGDASDVATLQSDVAALQTITDGLGAASTYGVANNLTQAAAGANVLDAYQGKLLGDRMTTAEGDIDTLNDGYANLGLTCVELLRVSTNVPTSYTSYACDWANYDFILINPTFWSNQYAGILCPKAFVNSTGTNTHINVYDDQNLHYELYKNGNTALYAKANTSSANRGFVVYGVKLAK